MNGIRSWSIVFFVLPLVSFPSHYRPLLVCEASSSCLYSGSPPLLPLSPQVPLFKFFSSTNESAGGCSRPSGSFLQPSPSHLSLPTRVDPSLTFSPSLFDFQAQSRNDFLAVYLSLLIDLNDASRSFLCERSKQQQRSDLSFPLFSLLETAAYLLEPLNRLIPMMS